MVRNVIHNTAFRIFAPLFYGVTMYILILLIFDSIEQLSENFFSIEVFITVFLTFLLFEVIRLFIVIVNKICPENYAITSRVLIQVGGSILLALILTSGIISFYFSVIIGFNTFRTELLVFNTIFVVSSILYNMVYFSFFYLNRVNKTKMEQEEILRRNLKTELETFKDRINPEFLYDSLETLIGLTKKDINKADQFILKLSDVYRNILSNKMTELSLFQVELKIVYTMLEILNYRYNNKITFVLDDTLQNKSVKIISGTLAIIIEDIVNKTIVSDIQPLDIRCVFENNTLKIVHPVQNKLVQVFSKQNELENLSKASLYLGNDTISISETNELRIYNIPVFKDDSL